MFDVTKYKQFGYVSSDKDITSCPFNIVTCISVFTNGTNYMISTNIAGNGKRRDFFKDYSDLKKYCAYHYENGIADICMTEHCEELWAEFIKNKN